MNHVQIPLPQFLRGEVARSQINPEVPVNKGMLVATAAMIGALQGGLTGALLTDAQWYEGLWRGALAGAAALGVVGGGLALAFDTVNVDNSPSCDPITIGRVLKDALSSGAFATIAGGAAGAAISMSTSDTAGGKVYRGAVWSAVLFAVAATLGDVTRKFNPPQECLPAAI